MAFEEKLLSKEKIDNIRKVIRKNRFRNFNYFLDVLLEIRF